MVVEANPTDLSALEALSEIYTKLGDEAKLARVAARLSAGRAQPGRESKPARFSSTRGEAARGLTAEPLHSLTAEPPRGRPAEPARGEAAPPPPGQAAQPH